MTLARAPSTAIPESHGPNPLTVLLNHLTILGPPERAFPSSFLPPHGVASTTQGHETTFAPQSGHQAPGTPSEKHFDLTGALRGASLMQDLTQYRQSGERPSAGTGCPRRRQKRGYQDRGDRRGGPADAWPWRRQDRTRRYREAQGFAAPLGKLIAGKLNVGRLSTRGARARLSGVASPTGARSRRPREQPHLS